MCHFLRIGQVRDPRHQRGAGGLQDRHLQQDQEQHETGKQVRGRPTQITSKLFLQVVGGDQRCGVLHCLQRRLQPAPGGPGQPPFY